MAITRTARILVIDDSSANIVAVRGMLGREYEVSFATSGPQALALLAQGYRPDLILLDVMMPGMDGYAVCAALRGTPAARDTPVVFITARTDPGSESRALAAGGLDFIHKPLDAAVLRARIGLHLQLRSQALALAEANAALSAANVELSRHRDHLEAQVDARTRELAAALDRAESANRAKSAFLSTIGHELLTPLNQILGPLQLVRKQLADDRLRGWLDTAGEAARDLLRLIKNILRYVEGESEDLVIAADDFVLAAMLNEAVGLIRPAADAKGLELSVMLDPAAPAWLKGDARRLVQVLTNLLDNAVKFSEQGRITLSVQSLALEHGTCELRFEVADQGIGIATEFQDRLFDLFELGDASLTRCHGGTGLGLALCKRLVGRMAGEIGADSTPGAGSRFWFSLRLPVVAAPVHTESQSESETGAAVLERTEAAL